MSSSISISSSKTTDLGDFYRRKGAQEYRAMIEQWLATVEQEIEKEPVGDETGDLTDEGKRGALAIISVLRENLP